MFSLAEALECIENEISTLRMKDEPENLYRPMAYMMTLGGKRMRPILTLFGYYLFQDAYKVAVRPAVCTEVFHNFTLIHDDLMDHAEVRRGKPTVHKKWNESVAVLSGDRMLVYAYEMLQSVPDEHLRQSLKLFSTCAADVCEGQQIDMDLSLHPNVRLQDYMHMIRLKTAVLPAFCMQWGAILGGARAIQAELMRQVGENMGLSFQIIDDLLDTFGTQAEVGKRIGGDILEGKNTVLTVLLREEATTEDLNLLETLFKTQPTTFEEEESKIQSVKQLYSKYQIDSKAKALSQEYFNMSLKMLTYVKTDESKKNELKEFLLSLQSRNR